MPVIWQTNCQTNQMDWEIITAAHLKGRDIVGRIVARNADGRDFYEVKSVTMNGYITALHRDGETMLKMFPEENLIKQRWWIKKLL